MSLSSLDHLRTFLTVYRVGSMTQAADLLGMSQGAVSAHVRALEHALSHSLFHRSPSGVVPTPKGAELARNVASHLDALDDALNPPHFGGSKGRAVHVGGAAEFLTTMILPRIGSAAAESGILLRFEFGLADELLDRLADRSVDIVLSSVPVRRQSLSAAPLYDEEFVLVAAPSWRDVTVGDIPVVAYAEDLPIVRRYWRTVFGMPPDQIRATIVVPDLRGVRAVVSSGVGMSVLPRYLVSRELEEQTLIELVVPPFDPLNTIYLVTRNRDGEADPAVGFTIRHLRQIIRQAVDS